jgi:glycerophosphoryl diester phosphodiesterase
MSTRLTVTAHRGASEEAPENTLAALRRAAAHDADRAEVDVQRTKDGALVLMHDTTLSRTTDVRRVFPHRAPWLVKDFTLAEIRRLDAGSWWSPTFRRETVPTLEEALAVLRPTGLGLLLELKAAALHPGLAHDVAHVLARAYGDRAAARDLTVQSFDHDAVLAHKELLPEVPVGALGSPAVRELAANAGWAAEINPMHGTVSRQYVEAVHRHGLRCHVWTVNRPARVRRAVDLGVDGIITNRPRVVRDLLTSTRLAR